MSQVAKAHLGIALAIGSFAFLIEGVWQAIAFIVAGILLLSFLIIWLFGKSRIARFLAQFSFDNVAFVINHEL